MNDEKINQDEAGVAKDSVRNMSLLQNLINQRHMPDILDCIANLSNDEVFTPPELADKVLDLLPEEVWHNKNLKWLDPACKTGIFLRQIALRLMKGLKDEIPDEEERRQHIFQNMLYGIAITNLTALMSRRSLYTSKNAGGEKSIAEFDNENGNISYDNRPHTYKNGSCIYCGNSQKGGLDRDETLERHAYNFIHLTSEEANNMKFDVIVGNPPYQLSDGGGTGSSAMPIYQLFIEQAMKLKPRYYAFIIPSRWFVGGKGLDNFRNLMLKDIHISHLVDFPNSADCFPGVDIKGGVCYFVHDENYTGPCSFKIMNEGEVVSNQKRYLNAGDAGVVIRYSEMISIVEKVRARHEQTLDSIVSSRKPYGLCADVFKKPEKYNLPKLYQRREDLVGDAITVYGLEGNKRAERYVPLDYAFPSGQETIGKWKIFIPKAYGCGAIGETIPTPILGTPISACTETFIRIGAWRTEEEAQNALKYLKTKFFRFLVGVKKTTQNTSKSTYSIVPLIDLYHEWTDKELYERYELADEEINFIEAMVKEME